MDAVRELLDGMHGTRRWPTASPTPSASFDAREQELDAAVRAFTGLDDVDAARERLTELRERARRCA